MKALNQSILERFNQIINDTAIHLSDNIFIVALKSLF